MKTSSTPLGALARWCCLLLLCTVAVGCSTQRSSPPPPASSVSLSVDRDAYTPGDSIRVTLVNASPREFVFGFQGAQLMQDMGGERVRRFDRYYAGPNPDIWPPQTLAGQILPAGGTARGAWRLDDDLGPGMYVYTIRLSSSDARPPGMPQFVTVESEPFTITSSEEP